MYPFFNIGPFAIPAKPFVMIIGFYAALWLVENTIDELKLEPEWLRSTAFNAIIVGLIGGRLIFALTHWQATFANPVSVIWPITIGYSLWGALLIGFLYLIVASVRQQVAIPALLDSIMPSILVLIGAWIIGDYLGGPGYGTSAEELPLFNQHPVQLYECIVILLTYWVWQTSRSQATFAGWSTLLVCAFFAAGMLITLNFRGGGVTIFGGWQVNQIVAFIIMLLTLGSLAFQSPKASTESLTSS